MHASGSKKRYLLIGGTGFLGSALARRLKSEADVAVFARASSGAGFDGLIRGDFAKTEDFSPYLEGVDCVYHLVNLVNPHKAGDLAHDEALRVLAPTRRLFDACRRQGVSKVVFVSSGGTVYGRQESLPIPETATGVPTNAYGQEKQLIERWILDNAQDLDYRIVRLANPYGPRADYSKGSGVVEMFLKRALAGQPVQLLGDGSAVKDYLYIDDAVEAMLAIERYGGKERVFNLGSGVGSSLADLIRSIEQVVGHPLDVERLEGRSYDVSYVLDMGLYEREVGPLAMRSLQEGVAETARLMAAV